MKFRIRLFSQSSVLLSTLILLSISTPAFSATHSVIAKIVRTNASNIEGGCIVHIDQPYPTELSACGAAWLNLDCTAIYHSPPVSNAIWSSAMLALALDKSIKFYVDPSVKAAGMCVVQRLDTLW